MKQTKCPENKRTNQFSRLFTFITVMALTATACKKGVADKQTAPNDDRVAATEATQTHTYIRLFDGGADGYHSFRIPSIVRTNDNTLLAFVEGRMAANKDYGNINVEYKRSTDNGVTWSAMKEVVAPGRLPGATLQPWLTTPPAAFGYL